MRCSVLVLAPKEKDYFDLFLNEWDQVVGTHESTDTGSRMKITESGIEDDAHDECVSIDATQHTNQSEAG